MREEWLTVPQAAERLQVTPTTVQRWLNSGKLKGTLLSRKAGWRVAAAEVERLLKATTPNPRQRLTAIRGHVFQLTANVKANGHGWEARVGEYDWSTAEHLPGAIIPGTDPPTNNPVLIATGDWRAEGPTAEAALVALEERIQTAMREAFAAGVRPIHPKGYWTEEQEVTA
ncbi:MAG: helix-turn-helix domain-containing protein [Chloroflexota bacterium]|nr:helix-turn-helix domain-containing protein [Chloroflexota bacterium]